MATKTPAKNKPVPAKKTEAAKPQAKAAHVVSGTTMPSRVYAWRPDVPDHRDRPYKLAKMAALPAVVDPIGKWNTIEDQGDLGSCTGNSSTSMLEIKLGATADSFSPLSRLMAYYDGRVIDGTVKTDAGAQIRSVIKGLVKSGVATEKTWPYVISRFAKEPSAAAVAEGSALAQQIAKQKLGYYRLTTLDDVLNCLASGNTFVFGFAAPETIENLPKNGVLRLPTKTTKMLGGHAVVGVGYDQKQRFIWVRNSWGPAWGLDGYFKMPFDWFTDPRRLVDDMWTLK